MSQYLLFIVQLGIIYLTARFVRQKLFNILRRLTKNTSVTFYILSLIYLPGTILHELSHFFTSIILFVRPHSIEFIPEVTQQDDKYYVKMGSVHHEKTDPIRGMLIGTAPLIYGLLFLSLTFMSGVFPNNDPWINVLFIYLFFAVSSSMFSSKQDLKESLILIPLGLLAVSALIGFDVDVQKYVLSDQAISLVTSLNLYIAAATITNTLGAVLLSKA